MMAVSEAFQEIHTIFEVRTFQDKSSGMRFVARRRSRVHNTSGAKSNHNEQTIAGANHFSSRLPGPPRPARDQCRADASDVGGPGRERPGPGAESLTGSRDSSTPLQR
jgi:hypothetical protein